MEITETVAPAAALAAASNTTPERAISSDFDTFLTMLTAQIENQDPLNPVDSADYAVQLATFSSVEQQVQTNDLLTALGQQFQIGGLGQLAAWVGMQAQVSGQAHFDGSPLTVVVPPQTGADAADLVVTNAEGAEISRESVSPDGGEFEWSGVDSTGAPLPPGSYSFAVAGRRDDLTSDPVPVDILGRVVEVRQSPEGLLAVLEGGRAVPASDVHALR